MEIYILKSIKRDKYLIIKHIFVKKISLSAFKGNLFSIKNIPPKMQQTPLVSPTVLDTSPNESKEI